MAKIFKHIAKLLKQKSTWVGAATIAASVGAPDQVTQILGHGGNIVGAVFGTALMTFDMNAHAPE